MASRYWVGGGLTTNWSATGNTNWSATSGGANNASVPGASDDIFFDALSPAGVSKMDIAFSCLSIDCTGYTHQITTTNNMLLTVTGNGVTVKFPTGTISWTGNAGLVFTGTSGTNLYTSGGTLGVLTQNGLGGTTQLQDACVGGSTCTITAGTLDLNGFNYSASNFTLTGAAVRSLQTTGGTISFGNAGGTGWNVTGSNLTLSLGTATLKATATNNPNTFAGGGKTYYNLWIPNLLGKQTTISGNNTFNNIQVDPLGVLALTSGSTQTVTSLTISGTAGNLVTLSASAAATIVQASGQVSCDYISLTKIVASGSVPFYAGVNSTDGGGNTNWQFTAPGTFIPAVFNLTTNLPVSKRVVSQLPNPNLISASVQGVNISITKIVAPLILSISLPTQVKNVAVNPNALPITTTQVDPSLSAVNGTTFVVAPLSLSIVLIAPSKLITFTPAPFSLTGNIATPDHPVIQTPGSLQLTTALGVATVSTGLSPTFVVGCFTMSMSVNNAAKSIAAQLNPLSVTLNAPAPIGQVIAQPNSQTILTAVVSPTIFTLQIIVVNVQPQSMGISLPGIMPMLVKLPSVQSMQASLQGGSKEVANQPGAQNLTGQVVNPGRIVAPNAPAQSLTASLAGPSKEVATRANALTVSSQLGGASEEIRFISGSLSMSMFLNGFVKQVTKGVSAQQLSISVNPLLVSISSTMIAPALQLIMAFGATNVLITYKRLLIYAKHRNVSRASGHASTISKTDHEQPKLTNKINALRRITRANARKNQTHVEKV